MRTSASRRDTDIGVATERAFLHVTVANPGVKHDLAKRGEVGVGLLGGADVRLGNYFGERRAAAVVVDIGLGGGLREAFVKVFRGVLFEMETRDADAFGGAGDFDVEPAAGGERQFVLRDLIALGEIGVEIVFAGET